MIFLLERSSGPSSLLKEVYLELVARVMSSWLSNISQGRDATTSLDNFYQYSVILTVKMCFLVYGSSTHWKWKPPVPMCAHCLWSCHWAPLKICSTFFTPSFQVLVHIDEILSEPSFLPSGGTVLALSAFPSLRDSPVLAALQSKILR